MAQLRLAMIQAHSGLPSALPARVPEQFAGKLDQLRAMQAQAQSVATAAYRPAFAQRSRLG